MLCNGNWLYNRSSILLQNFTNSNIILIESIIANDMDESEEEQLTEILLKRIKEMLNGCGSIEMMASCVMSDIWLNKPIDALSAQDNSIHLTTDYFIMYDLGLILSNGNHLKSEEPLISKIEEFHGASDEYKHIIFKQKDRVKESGIEHIEYNERNNAIDFRIYTEQREEYYQRVFEPLDSDIMTKYGFTVRYANDFAKKFAEKLQVNVDKRFRSSDKKFNATQKLLTAPATKDVVESLTEVQCDTRNASWLAAEKNFYKNAQDLLTVRLDERQGRNDYEMYKNYLNTFSCSLGGQTEGFPELTSENILETKPIIKINDESFFLPLYTQLHRVDVLLESILKDDPIVWNDLFELKLKYINEKIYEYFSRVFPQECIFQNVYYKDRKVDLLVVYDTKILVVGHDVSGKGTNHKDTVFELIEKITHNGEDIKSYVESESKVTFWKDRSKKDVLFETKHDVDYKFFFMGITLDSVGHFLPNIAYNNMHSFQHQIPLLFYLHDMDTITDKLRHPIYLIHYLEKRAKMHKLNTVLFTSELSALSGYLENMMNVDYMLAVSVKKSIAGINEQDFLNAERTLDIPVKLEDLLLNMQKYRQKGFTEVTSLLLDFPDDRKKEIGKMMKETINYVVSKGEIRGGFLVNGRCGFGFGYYANNTMKDFYKFCKEQIEDRKSEYGITKYAVIGRNVVDKKNFATFFIYDDEDDKYEDDDE